MASKRRKQILETALTLFNEQGAANVTTNHIAAAMGISPGNLYYHFRSKEEIIAAIVEQMVTSWDPMYQVDLGASFTLETLSAMQRLHFELLWEYRFFYREVPTLLRRDPQLKARYFEIRDQRIVQQIGLVKTIAQTGAIRLPPDKELHQLFTITWILADTWLAFQELEEDWDESKLEIYIERGVSHVLSLYKPYFFESQ
ncbi:MAG: TetR/AcrR family transcriptional regulator [Chloroflexota bacterium]